jgi:hypothetical protein
MEGVSWVTMAHRCGAELLGGRVLPAVFERFLEHDSIDGAILVHILEGLIDVCQ